MKESITVFNNAVVARFPNRRVAVMENKTGTGVRIAFTNIIKGKSWKPVKTRRIKGCKVVTEINISYEAMHYLLTCYHQLIKIKKDALKLTYDKHGTQIYDHDEEGGITNKLTQ